MITYNPIRAEEIWDRDIEFLRSQVKIQTAKKENDYECENSARFLFPLKIASILDTN